MCFRKKLKDNAAVYAVYRFVLLKKNYVSYHISKKRFTEKLFYKTLGYPLNLENPKTFNEKIQWLKLNAMTPDMVACADKYALREFISQKFPEYRENFPKLLATYQSSAEIDLNQLPQQFVIKCNHGCGFNFVCADKGTVDIYELRRMVDKWMNTSYEYVACEPQYHKMKRVIFAEEFLNDGAYESSSLVDYKFYCTNGTVRAVMVCLNRNEEHIAEYYYLTPDWQPLQLDKRVDMNKTASLGKPEHFEMMLEMAKKMSKEFAFVRVDFYDTKEKVIIGELTFTPAGGIDSDFEYETDRLMGDWIDLPDQENNDRI